MLLKVPVPKVLQVAKLAPLPKLPAKFTNDTLLQTVWSNPASEKGGDTNVTINESFTALQVPIGSLVVYVNTTNPFNTSVGVGK